MSVAIPRKQSVLGSCLPKACDEQVIQGTSMLADTLDQIAALYETDETAWLDAMAELVREGHFSALDYPHLGEYLTDMARRDRREVESRLALLIAHLLKWTHQPDRRSGSWRATVEIQRQELARLFQSGTLRNHAVLAMADAYADGVRQAAAETGLPIGRFPEHCPYTLEQLEGFDLLAEE